MTEQSKDKLLKRARSKYLSNKLAIRLLEGNPDSPLKDSYLSTLGCCDVLLQEGKKLCTTRCKLRWCATCNRVRTAKLIDNYEPAIRQFNDPWFLTLTKKTVPAGKLKQSMLDMYKACRTINQSKEGRKRSIDGIRKNECTTRPNYKYHPHFHLVIDGESNAKWYYEQWLNHFGSLASYKGQDCRQADEKSLKELFKYFTKLTVSEKDKDGKKLPATLVEPDRLDLIFRCLKGTRVYQPFGKVRSVNEEITAVDELKYEFLEEKTQIWKWGVNDWINEAGDCLTNYKPSQKFESIFQSHNVISEESKLVLL